MRTQPAVRTQEVRTQAAGYCSYIRIVRSCRQHLLQVAPVVKKNAVFHRLLAGFIVGFLLPLDLVAAWLVFRHLDSGYSKIQLGFRGGKAASSSAKQIKQRIKG